MEHLGGFRLGETNRAARKKRSDRRPRNDIQAEYHGGSSLSSSPTSDIGSKGLSDDHMKQINLNQCNSRASYTNLTDPEKLPNVSSDFETQESSDGKDTGVGSSEAVFGSNYTDMKYDTPTSDGHNTGLLEVSSDAKGKDSVMKKVKLKVGGVTCTLHAKASSDAVPSVSMSSVFKPPRSSTSNHSKQKIYARGNSDEDYSYAQDQGSGLRGIPWKDFSGSGFCVGKVDSSSHEILEESTWIKKSDKQESVRKSTRVPKRRLLDEDDDVEMRFLEKLKSKTMEIDDEDEGGSKKQRKILSVIKMGSHGSSGPGKERKKAKPGRESENTDYVEEEQSISEGEPPQFKSGKQRKACGREMAVMTLRQAIQSGRDVSTISGTGLVEFPNGLPPAPSKKQKDKLSEVELQLKKAEAAQRRKMQVEKAARESEAEAIRKILGQDSSRKKREIKMQQRREELAQERASNAAALASKTVRWVIGPTGTVVTFSDDMGLPNIFESRPYSYPPPREKCAGPSCSNPFKYRDSRTKLPLCSLHCYKAVQETTQPPGSVC